jgi:Zn-dependent protease
MVFRLNYDTGTLSLGAILGVPVYVHGSFILLAGGLSYGFWTRGELVLTAIFIAMLFASILMHELAHALVARRYRAIANRIDIYFFGGLVEFWGPRRTVAQDCAISLAGPLSNLVIGLAALGLLALIQAEAPQAVNVGRKLVPALYLTPSILERALRATAYVNLALCVINLLPAFPLDGGRVVYLLAEQRFGRNFATLLVSSAGMVFAMVSIVVLFVTMLAGFPVWSPPTFSENWRAFQAARQGRGGWGAYAI